MTTRERIKAVAGDLYVRRGHDGFSFGDIAKAVGTTRANIHHHFGNKRRLMDELVAGFVADAEARIAGHWTDGNAAFAARLARQVADLRRFYRHFNPGRGDRNVWSPLARLRLDMTVLGAPARAALARINRVYARALKRALAAAIAAGELRADTPVEDVARMLRVSLLACPPLTQDSGDFADIEKHFRTLGAALLGAWGTRNRARH